MSDTYRIFVGIDWGAETHQVWVSDATGERVAERIVAHTGAAIAELAEWLVTLADGDATAVAVAVEVPRGPIVDALLERGCHVFAVNPKQLDRFRDRFSAAGAKDDRRDARVLSSAVRTDRVAFRHVEVDDPRTIQLREYSRQDTELGEDLRRLANRLRDHLLRTWPELLQVVPAADERWLWGLLKLAPTPAEASQLRPARLRHLLRDHRIRRLTAEELVTIVRTPSVRLAPGVREGVRVRILDLVDQLRVVEAQRRQAERRLAAALDALTSTDGEQGREHQDVTILQSLPALGTRIAATMLAEAARALRDRDYHALRVLGGCAPVTKRSGKRCVILMRYACDHHLQTAVYHWAKGCLQQDQRCRAHYAQLRRAGHSHGRALRGVADRMLAVLIAMLKGQTLYDAARRRQRAAA
ncbi:MAG: transposase [Acidobacteria bacterium]|nr:transposase [Acidobacteriota bacterium]